MVEENENEDNGNFRFTPEVPPEVPLEATQETPTAEDTLSVSNETDASKAKPHRIRSLAFVPEQHLGNFGDNIEARQIHDNFHIHEEGLKRKTEQRQKKAKRKTQMRLKTRTKLKDSKALFYTDS